MERKPYAAAVLFLLAAFGGAFMLLAGLVTTGSEYAGFLQPQRDSYGVHARSALARTAPEDHRGPAREVKQAPLLQRTQRAISAAEPAVNSSLDDQHWFIQFYGGLQSLSGRTVLEDVDPAYSVVKLSDGTLTFLNPEEKDVTDHAKAVVRLRDVLQAHERRHTIAGQEKDGAKDGKDEEEEALTVPLLYVQAPQKVQADDPRLPEGTADYGNAYADQLLAILEEEDVATLDLRPILAQADPNWANWFFRTDHHWTPEAAFAAHQALTEVLRQDYGFDIDDIHTDPNAFRRLTYQDWFLGSQGKRTGTLYGGVDGITLWAPKYPTDFTYSIPNSDLERTGSFTSSLLFAERVQEKDFFGGNPYTLYAGGDYSMARIYNHMEEPEEDAEDEPGKRVLLLRDSFACAITPFLALDCSELITMDLRYFHGNLSAYINWLDPDLVIVMYAPGSCANDPLFDFFQTGLSTGEPEQPSVTLSRPGETTDIWTAHRKD